jgi:hypothetical protein
MTSGSFVYFLPRSDPWVIGNPRPAKHDRHFYYERAIREREGGGGGCPRELLDDWWEEGVEELNLVRSHPKVFLFAPHSFFEGSKEKRKF